MRNLSSSAFSFVRTLVTVCLIASGFPKIYAQCNIGGDGSAPSAPTSCNTSANISIGPGGFFSLPVEQNTYYTFTLASSGSNILTGSPVCINGTAYASGSTWFSSTNTSVQLGVARNGSGAIIPWSSVTSSALNYKREVPSFSYTTASPACSPSGASVSIAATGNVPTNISGATTVPTLYWQSTTSGGTSTGTSGSPQNVSPTVNSTYYYNQLNGSTSGGCWSGTGAGVTINMKPVVGNQTATICSGTSFTVTPSGQPSGTTYTWTAPSISPSGAITGGSAQPTGQTSISQTLTNSTNASATATYTVTPATATCTGATFTVTVTVLPQPAPNAGTAQAQCNSGSFTLNGSVPRSGETGTWSCTGGCTGVSIGSPNAYNSPVSGVGTGVTTTLQWLISNGTCSNTSSVTLTNDALPVISGNSTVCDVDANVPYSSTVSSTGWSVNPGTAGTITTGGSFTPANIATPTSSAAAAIKLQNGTCQASYNVTIYNKTTITSSSASMCQGEVRTLTASVTGTTFSGTGVTFNGTNYIFTAPNPGGTSANYIITASNGTATCQDQQVITVFQTPAATLSVTETSGNTNNDANICRGDNATLTASGGTGYTWDNGLGSGSTHTVNPTSTTTYNVTVTGSNGCNANLSQTITVKSLPKLVNSTTPPDICSGTTFTFNAATNVATTSQVWTRASVTGINGGASGSGSGNISEVLNNSTTSSAAVTYHYVMTSTDGCPGSDNVVVNVKAAVIVNAGVDQAVCSGGNITLAGSIGGSAGSATWTTSGSGSFTPNNTTLSATYTPSAGDISAGSVTLTLTAHDPSGTCSNVADNMTITIYPLPSVAASNGGPYGTGQTISLFATPSGGTPAYTYSWNGPLSYTSTAQNPTIASATTAMSGSYGVTVTDSHGCQNTDATSVVVTTTSTCTWTGAVDTMWTNASNWSPNRVPNSCSDNVIIPNTVRHPSVISSAVSVGNIQLNSNAQLHLFADVNVCGDWTGGTTTFGTVSGTAMVILQGAGTHVITGKTNFDEVKLNNTSGGVTMSGASVNVTRALDLQSGAFDATGGTLTFKSSSSSSVGIIDNFSSGYSGTLVGSVKVERHYDAASPTVFNEHFMGSPVDAPTFSQFGATGTAGFIVPTANCDETRVSPGSPYGTVMSYHEANGAVCASAQWKAEISGNAVNGQGYSVAKVGSGTMTLTGNANLNSTYTVTGLTNSGWAQTITLQGRPVGPGWHLLSNPYDASLEITHSVTDFDDQIQVWQTSGPLAGSYQVGLVGSLVTPAVVAPFQAFMVHKSTAGGTSDYTIYGSDRIRTPQVFHHQNASELNLTVENLSTGLMDKTMVAFNQDATAGFDPHFDANKAPGSLNRQTLYTLISGNQWMSHNILHTINETSTVAMGFEPGNTASYTFTFDGVNSFDPTTYIFLEDRFTHTMHNARSGPYTFSADSADAWDRFVLHFTPAVEINALDATCNAPGTINIAQPGSASWNYILTDVNNDTISSGLLDQYHVQNISAAEGDYQLVLTDLSGYTVTKPIHMNGVQHISAAFNVSQSNVNVGDDVEVSATANNAVNYDWNFGNGTSGTGQSVTLNYQQPGVYTVELSVTSQSGCVASSSQNITVNAVATGIGNIVDAHAIGIWSAENTVYVDFTSLSNVDAVISIYNLLGQEISNEKFTSNVVYRKEVDQLEPGYMIVSVKNDDKITTKKVFLIGKN